MPILGEQRLNKLHPSLLASVVFLLIMCVTAAAEPRSPVLVELFTSEGCSSCPPADALLRALDSLQPIPGAQLVVLEEHVDYWDDQGWRDPFSSHAFTVRQTGYVDRLHVKNGPYTPQMLVDGTEAFVGGDKAKAVATLQKAATNKKIPVELSSVRVENGKVFAHVTTAEVPDNAQVFMALALDHAQSQVSRGENGWQTSRARCRGEALKRHRKLKKDESFSKDVDFEVDDREPAYRLIAFIQAADGKVLGATMTRFEDQRAQKE